MGRTATSKPLSATTVPLLVTERGGREEIIHRGLLVVVNAKGKILKSFGNPSTLCYLRSVAKPIQALPFIEAGGITAFGLRTEELAILAGSHSGEPEHVRLVYSILSKGGFTPAALQCGVDYPSHGPTRSHLRRTGKPKDRIYHNCSGKHAGMLLASKLLKAKPDRYRDPKSPLQTRIRAIMAKLTRSTPGRIPFAIDGCAAPTYALPLHATAWLFAQLAVADGDSSLATIAAAMKNYPFAIGGTGSLDTILMQVIPGLVTKGGAAGIHAFGIPSKGLGVAIKVEGGDQQACRLIVVEALRQLHMLPTTAQEPLKKFMIEPLTNSRNDVVGRTFPMFKL